MTKSCRRYNSGRMDHSSIHLSWVKNTRETGILNSRIQTLGQGRACYPKDFWEKIQVIRSVRSWTSHKICLAHSIRLMKIELVRLCKFSIARLFQHLLILSHILSMLEVGHELKEIKHSWAIMIHLTWKNLSCLWQVRNNFRTSRGPQTEDNETILDCRKRNRCRPWFRKSETENSSTLTISRMIKRMSKKMIRYRHIKINQVLNWRPHQWPTKNTWVARTMIRAHKCLIKSFTQSQLRPVLVLQVVWETILPLDRRIWVVSELISVLLNWVNKSKFTPD